MAESPEKLPVPDGADDIDWGLLLLLARVEASLIWPDQAPLDGFGPPDSANKAVH